MASNNLFQKLIEVRSSCEYLKKDQSGFQFKYVSSSQTLGALREKMDEAGLLLVPRVLRVRVSDHATKSGAHEYFTELWVHFTWVNADKPEEKLRCPWYGQGLDNGEKGVGKALTYAEKYFLLKFFNIATDKDDPDSFQRKNAPKKKAPLPPKKVPEKKKVPTTPPPPTADDKITEAQVKKLNAMITEATFDRVQIKLHLKVSSLKELTADRAHRIFDKWEVFKEKFVKWEEGR